MTESAPKAPRAHLPALTAVRGIAALWVVLFHLRHETEDLFPEFFDELHPLFKSGFLGVDLFFVLSGFVIALNYQARFATFKPSVYWQFMVKRFARIYPVYLATLMLTVLMYVGFRTFGHNYLHPERFTLPGFVQSLTMTQSLTFPMPRQWNIVAWSVSAEWFAYMAFPLIAAGAMRLKGLRSHLLAFVGVFALYSWVLHQWLRPSVMELGVIRVGGCFCLGVLICGMRDALPVRWAHDPRLAKVGLMLALLLPSLYWTSMEFHLHSVTWAPLYFAAFIFVLAQPGAQRWIWKHPLMIHLGHISFSVYMIHGTTIMTVRAFVGTQTMMGAHPILQAGYIMAIYALCVAAGHWLYTRVEEPARRLILAKVARPKLAKLAKLAPSKEWAAR